MRFGLLLLVLLVCGCDGQRLKKLQAETATVDARLRQLEPLRPEIERVREEVALLDRRRVFLKEELARLKGRARKRDYRTVRSSTPSR